MKDGSIRFAVKRLALLSFLVDLKVTRAIWRLRGRRPHKLGGSCGLCAECCESPMIQTGLFVFNMPILRRLFLAWHKHVNGFEFEKADSRSRTFVFRCTHFDWQARRCDSYASRPGMCRDYPRVLLWDSDPPFLAGCGYHAVSRRAARVAELIDAEDLPPEKREELKRKLHARDS